VKHNHTQSDIRAYFWSLVDKNGPVPAPTTGVKSKCWLWLGSVTDQGYGRFKAGGAIYMARRFAWQEMGKPEPGALTVATRCSNKLCVRHLSTRTRAEIMASISRRWASGEASHHGKRYRQNHPFSMWALEEEIVAVEELISAYRQLFTNERL
jgi:hypothetical protein